MLFYRLMMKNPTWGNDHLLLSVMLLLLLFLAESSFSKHTMQSQAPDPCWLLLVIIVMVMAELMPFLLPGRVFTSWKLLTIAAMLAKCYCSPFLAILLFKVPHSTSTAFNLVQGFMNNHIKNFSCSITFVITFLKTITARNSAAQLHCYCIRFSQQSLQV